MIVPLGVEHVDAVAQLHCAALRGLLSELGAPAARAYYTGCVRADSAVGFVYVENGVVRGYVLGSAHPDRLKREVLRRNPVGTLAGLCVGFMRQPSSLARLLKSVRGPDEGTYDGQVAELTYLAVVADCRRGGIGRQLIDAFAGAMREAGVQEYELSVDDDNRAAIGFYERLGFRLTGSYLEFGLLHRRYRLGSERLRDLAAAPRVSVE